MKDRICASFVQLLKIRNEACKDIMVKQLCMKTISSATTTTKNKNVSETGTEKDEELRIWVKRPFYCLCQAPALFYFIFHGLKAHGFVKHIFNYLKLLNQSRKC